MLNSGTQCGGQKKSAVRRAAIFASKAAFVIGAALFLPAVISCASLGGTNSLGQNEARQSDEAREAALPGFKISDGADELFLPERFEEIEAGHSAFTFKTSASKAALYVNGDYHGLTPLKVADLLPGRYYVQIKKRGFKSVTVAIQVQDGVSDFYYIEMQAEDEPEPRAIDLEAPRDSESGGDSSSQSKRQ